MLLPGAEALEMSHRECQELLESVEDTLDFLTSTLTYLIYAESKKTNRACGFAYRPTACKQMTIK